MKVVITGARGFLGWHGRCAAWARGHEVVPIGRELTDGSASAQSMLQGVDVVFHFAGVNRPTTEADFNDNVVLAERLTEAMEAASVRPVVVFANSIQSGYNSPFGQTKAAAGRCLADWGRRARAPLADVRLPNLFGEHGRPGYNSVVATFCDALANDREPTIVEDREIPVLHVQDALDQMLTLAEAKASGTFKPEGTPVRVSQLLAKLSEFRDLYKRSEIPDVAHPLDRALFNTYRSFCFPKHYPMHLDLRADARGHLFEAVRSHGGKSQTFASTTRPGVTRGNHFHFRKIERFLVLKGSAAITLRRMFHDDVVRFDVSGDRPAVVDMPTLWTHALTNVGTSELTTLFWADEIFDPAAPDTYAEPVVHEKVAS